MPNLDMDVLLGTTPSLRGGSNYEDLVADRTARAIEWQKQQPKDFSLGLAASEGLNILFEGASEITRGLAGFVGQAEEADTQIRDMRDWLRDSAGFAVGDDAWTQTKPGKVAADVLSYLAPGIAATAKVAKLGKLRKWTPKQTAAGIIGADSLTAFAVTDPTDMLSIGNLIGGPTEIHPDDDAYTKKAKILAETAVFGTTLIGGLGYLGHSMRARRLANAEKAGKAIDEAPVQQLDEADFSTADLNNGYTVKSVLDGNTYTWQSGAWINALGQPAPIKNGFSRALTLQYNRPRLLEEIQQQVPGFGDLSEGRRVQYQMPELISGETTVDGGKFTWGALDHTGKKIIPAPDYIESRWINTAKKKDETYPYATPARAAKLNETFAPGLRTIERKGSQWINPKTEITYPARSNIARDLNQRYRSPELGEPNPPPASLNQTFGEASDASGAPRILTGTDDTPTGGGGGGAEPPTGGTTAAAGEPKPSRWARFRGAGRKAGDRAVMDLGWMGAKAISPLDVLARNSVNFRRLRNTMEHFEESEALKGIKGELHDFYEHLHTVHGKYFGKMQDIMDKIYLATPEGALAKMGRAVPGLRTIVPVLSDEQNLQLVRALRGGQASINKLPETLKDAAKDIRKLLDGILDDAQKAGLDVKRRTNYFPRVHNWKAWNKPEGRAFLESKGIKNPDEVIQHFERNGGVEDATFVEQVIAGQRQAAREGRKYVGRKGKKQTNLEKARTLLANTPDNELEPFLSNNLYGVLSDYINNTGRRITYANLFGPNEEILSQWVREGSKELKAQGIKIDPRTLDRVYEIADVLQQRFNPTKHSQRMWNKFSVGAATYQNIRTLAMATLASLAEPMVALMRGGTAAFIKAVPTTIDSAMRGIVRNAFRGVKRGEAEIAAKDIGLAADAGGAAAIERLTQGFGGEVNKLNTAWFDLTLLSQWTKFTRIFADQVGQNLVKSNIKALATRPDLGQKVLQKYQRQLLDLGIDPQEAIKYYRSTNGMSNIVSDADIAFRNNVINRARVRFINDVIMNPRVTNRPMWHSDPRFATISNLKGFQTVFGNTVMKRWYREVAPEIMGGRSIPATEKAIKAGQAAATGVVMLGIIDFAGEARDRIKWGSEGNPRKNKMTPSERFWDNVYRSGFTGAGQFAIDAKRSVQFGSSPLATVLGPTATQLELAVRRPSKALKTALPITGQSQFLQEQIGDVLFEPEPATARFGTPIGGGKGIGGARPLGKSSGGPITSAEVTEKTELKATPYQKLLDKYSITARRAERPEGKTGHAEYYPADERDNPEPGTDLIEVYNEEITGPNLDKLVIGEAIHGLKTKDPVLKKLTDEFKYIMKNNPVQRNITKAHYRNAVNRDDPETRRPDKWFDISYADQVLGNMLFGPLVEGQQFMEEPYPYTDRQRAIGLEINSYIKQNPRANLQEGGSIDDVLQMIAAHETRGYDNPWVRTSFAPEKGSSAYGPLQITKGSLEDLLQFVKLTNDQKRFAKELIGEQELALEFGKEPDKKGYEEIYEYSDVPSREDYNPERGTYKWGREGPSEEEQALYWQLGNQLFKRKAKILEYDPDNLSEEEFKEVIGAWHGGGEDIIVEDYIKKVIE